MMVNSTDSVVGVTGGAFHGFMLFLVSFGIVGNTSVIVWRCSVKESRFSLLSSLIVSLATADLLYCIHFLFQEALLFPIVFSGETGNHTFTNVDETLCLSSTFTFFLSCNIAVLTAAGIAAYTLLTFRGGKQRSHALVLFMVLCWILSFSVAAAATWKLKEFFDKNHSSSWVFSVDLFSLRIIYGCMGDFNMMLFPAIVCSLNAAVTVVCIIIYGCVVRTLRKIHFVVENSEVKVLQIRLSIIVVLNVVCWWPADVLYWYSYTRHKNVFNGELSPRASEPVLLFTAITSAVNPVIYTIASKKVFRCLYQCLFRGCKRDFCKRRTVQLLEPLIPYNDNDRGRCCTCCSNCKLFGRRKSDFGVMVYYVSTESNKTEEESLFPETEVKIDAGTTT